MRTAAVIPKFVVLSIGQSCHDNLIIIVGVLVKIVMSIPYAATDRTILYYRGVLYSVGMPLIQIYTNLPICGENAF
jgi:hypothetical protein